MSQRNVEVVHRAIEANRSDDLEAAVEALVALSDPSIEYTSVMAALESRTYVLRRSRRALAEATADRVHKKRSPKCGPFRSG